MTKPDSERLIKREIMRMIGSQRGVRLFNNPCGSVRAESGHYVVYGVANPGGSDIIGWQEIEITPEMVGTKIARFVAIECKTRTPGGKRIKSATPEQQNFIERVKMAGGAAGVAADVPAAFNILGIPQPY